MFFKHIYEKGLAQASYLIGCQATKEAIVIDPRRDIKIYLETAEKEKLKITHITETHIHADFLSGSQELADATGAKIYLSDEGGDDWHYNFHHQKLIDGSEIKVGNLSFKIIHTPGHTPEHISFLLTDNKTSSKPVMLFTGDFVFVGDVGRPDLLEKAAGISGTMEKSAKQMFSSVQSFKKLEDHLQLWPGHGAGSACGKALGAVPSSTVGYEKFTNWALQIENETQFVETLLSGQPEPPKYFAIMKKMNKEKREIINQKVSVKKLSHQEIKSLFQKKITVIDTRNKDDFAKGYIPSSINIPDNNAFTTWAGWILKYDEPFVLFSSDERIDELKKSLMRIGLDNLLGYFDSLENFSQNGDQIEKIKMISAKELAEANNNYEIFDVRAESEFIENHIRGAVNIHAGFIEDNINKIPKNKNVVLNCASGDRSSTAASVLLKHGYKNVFNLNGGIDEWKRSGYKTVQN